MSATVTPLPTARVEFPACTPQPVNPDRMLRRDEVEIIAGISRSTIYRYMHAKKFPAARDLGGGAVGWRESEVHRWCATRPVRAAFR